MDDATGGDFIWFVLHIDILQIDVNVAVVEVCSNKTRPPREAATVGSRSTDLIPASAKLNLNCSCS